MSLYKLPVHVKSQMWCRVCYLSSVFTVAVQESQLKVSRFTSKICRISLASVF